MFLWIDLRNEDPAARNDERVLFDEVIVVGRMDLFEDPSCHAVFCVSFHALFESKYCASLVFRINACKNVGL